MITVADLKAAFDAQYEGEQGPYWRSNWVDIDLTRPEMATVDGTFDLQMVCDLLNERLSSK